MNRWSRAGIALGVFAVTTLALAQRPTPDQQANEYRQALMVLLAGNMQPMAGMARGRADYDAGVVETNAERVRFLADMIADAFTRDTSGASLETESLPEIWANKAGFDENAAETVTRAEALLAAVRSGNEEATKEAIGALGGSCGDCHDRFRQD